MSSKTDEPIVERVPTDEAVEAAEEPAEASAGKLAEGDIDCHKEAPAEDDPADDAAAKADTAEEAEDGGKEHEAPTELDLVFLVDCTGSMGSYIAAAQASIKSIIESLIAYEKCDVRFALISYRDHPPQDRTYVTKVHDFTKSMRKMRSYVDGMSAKGGGDGPEAVAAAMYEATQLPWRKEATKVAILIADAPPHGLPGQSDGFPDGCPDGHDPLDLARQLAAREVMVYTVGCEPALGHYTFARDFMVTVAEITGGQAVALDSAAALADVILNGAREELGLEMLMKSLQGDLESELARIEAEGGDEAAEEAAVEAMATRMRSAGMKTKQMRAKKVVASSHYGVFSKASSLSAVRSELGSAVEHASRHKLDRRAMPRARASRARKVRKKKVARRGSGGGISGFISGLFSKSTSSAPVAEKEIAPSMDELGLDEDSMTEAEPRFLSDSEDEDDEVLGDASIGSVPAPAAAMPAPAAASSSFSAAAAPAYEGPVALEEELISTEQVRRMFSKHKRRRKRA
eukprot:PLAT5631.1.p1 GENE.PLAT5631.1~~PLAT5631.1.p1  ORF type:complete len:517 (-),score=179.83 PLAT5631.1:78-1628(-)